MPVWLQNIIRKEVALIKRCYQFFIQPKVEWEAVTTAVPEPMTLFKESILYIVALPAIARLLSWGILDFPSALVSAILWYGLMIGVLWGVPKGVCLLAPSFESSDDFPKAFTLTFYSILPFLVGGIFYMIPLLTILAPLMGLYGIYLLWLGLPVLLTTPDKQRLIYTAVIGVVEIILVLLVSRLTGGIVLSL